VSLSAIQMIIRNVKLLVAEDVLESPSARSTSAGKPLLMYGVRTGYSPITDNTLCTPLTTFRLTNT